MNEIFIFMFSYLGVMLITLLVANMITKGFVFRYLKAKAGKRRGVVMLNILTPYFDLEKTGKIKEGWLTYKDREKRIRRLAVPEGATFGKLGVIWLDVDEEKNIILKRDKSGASGFDANKYEDLYIRALNRSKLNDYKQILQIIIFVAGIGALFSLVGIVMLSQAKKQIISQLQYCDLRTLVNATIQTAENVITGGNI